MVIKGYIVSIPEPGDNHFQVRIPFIEDNTGVEIIMTALLCSQPGVYGGYDIGDCVFVSFEGDKHMDDDVITDTPVIIGKLYQDEPTGVHNNCIIESLTVSSKAELPSNTTFGGQSASDIFDLIQNVNVINNSLKDLEEKVEKIEQDSEIDWDSVKSIREELDEFKDKVDSEVEEIEEKLSNLPTEEEIQEIISEVSDLTTEIEELSSEIIGLSSTVNNLSETVGGIIGNYVDLSTNQVIDGQKDFEVVPRIKIEGEHPREGLPDSYTQLQYVESNGGSGGPYIDTGYTIVTSTDTVELVFEIDDTTLYQWLFGEHDNNARFGLGVGDGTNRRNVAYGSTTYKVNDSMFYGQLHYFKADYSGISIDNVSIANYSSFTSTSTLALFCLNNGGFISNAAGKIQSYKHTRNGTVLIDLVSVKRNSDDKPGFYDFVSNSFIYSNSNTDLIAGPELPGDYYESVLTDAGIPTNLSQLNNDVGYVTTSYHDPTKANQSSLDTVTAKIPSAATSSNQLADKAFVNSSISTATATFRGTYTTLADLQAASGDLNDYAFYSHTDSQGNTVFDRYKYTSNTPHWEYEYTLNNSSFTSVQWEAINSGVTAGDWVDRSTAQVIDGQKDFEVVPRIYVDPEGTSHNLPSGYDELLYLANTGEQYIDCNYTPAANSDIVFDMEVGCTRQTGRRNFLCCCGTTVYGHYCEILPNGYFGTRINNIDYVTDVFAQPNQKYSVKMTKIANAGNSVSVTVGESTVTCTAAQSKSVLSPIYLFRLASGYTGESIIFYSCKIYVNNTLIRDMYPCERISDHTLGMYDKANDVFYSNAGGGQFISGGSINPHYEPVLTGSRLSEVAYTGDYNSLYGTPIIPTVNNPLITIKQGTVSKGTFNLNQSSAKTITLDGINDLLKQVSGYDGTVSQTLKHNANGVIQWVND